MTQPLLNSIFEFLNKPFKEGGGQASKLDHLPVVFISEGISTAAALLVNHLLAQRPALMGQLSAEADKVMVFHVSPFRVGFEVKPDGSLSAVGYAAEGAHTSASTEIQFEWADVIGAVSQPSKLAKKAKMSGDVEFAQAFSAVLNGLHWDVETDLAKVVGDAQAVWIVSGLNKMGIGLQDLFERLKSNLHEYVVYEKQMLPSTLEFDAFCEEVSSLRDQVARLEKRLSRFSKS